MRWRLVTHAIVSREGSIADRAGLMPPCLHVPEDQSRFRAALAAADVTVLGREGHERHPAEGRARLVLTSRVDGIEARGNTVTWNPDGASLADALARFEGDADGRTRDADGRIPDAGERVAVIAGGTRVMTTLLPHTDRFDLAVASQCSIPDGRPCLESAGSVEGIEARLEAAGLVRTSTEALGAATLQVWERR